MAANPAEIFETVQSQLVEMFGVAAADVSPSSKLREDFDFDSIDAINFAVRLEEIFDRRLPRQNFQRFQTVADVVAAIEEVLA